MNNKACFLLVFICSNLMACAVGKESILFVTKTSIAVDVDTNPPTFDVGYGRYEGSIAPVVTSGEVLPLLSSISADAGINSKVFGSGVAQNFGVGNAAVIMSQYLGSQANPVDNSSTSFATLVAAPASVTGSTATGRRYFFGTKTTVGFTTSFAPERGFSPDSISLGYKRKEFAYVPIRQNGTGAETRLSIPSMLATSGTSTSAGVNQSGFSTSQFYATGMAANYLAAHPVIRNSVISKIIGDEKISDKLEAAEKTAIGEIDMLRLEAEIATLKAGTIIDGLAPGDLDGALQSMKLAGITDSSDAFRDIDNDGTISDEEKRARLKSLSYAFGDEELLAKINQWVSDNN